MVRTDFWSNPIVLEEMTPEDKYFYLYLLTNPNTTQCGIYLITKKQMAFDLGYSIESVQSLMERFEQHHKLIRYNLETRELAIKNWGKENLLKGGKPLMDCVSSELKEIEDITLIQYVSESIHKEEIRSLYESFCKHEEVVFNTDFQARDNKGPSVIQCEQSDDTFLCPDTILEQKEIQQETFYQNIENHPGNPLQNNQKTEDAKDIIEFWDSNGFGYSNVNAKQQLLSWLDDSSFLQPKEMILKAMNIACANNKRRLNYIVGILKNWENESLLTVDEVDSYEEKQKPVLKNQQSNESVPGGRAIPSGFELDLTAGEKE
ncbi:DnaD domain-containing protein [Bacillus sp. Marseille-P3661]|uniref:DnaD domain-containing protein n=1 Tax=Bacillus sp. Marseille-P3661 TaxID=1936234 RepID=UPI000C84BDD2|nr:DnaD domain protein [Bacillus sp. Marseille-P3661]